MCAKVVQESKTLVWDPTPSTPVWDWKRAVVSVRRWTLLVNVAGSIFGWLSQTHFSESELKNEISSSALLDIQMALFCVSCPCRPPDFFALSLFLRFRVKNWNWNSRMDPRIRTFDRKKNFTFSFPKRIVWNQIHGFRFMSWSWGQLLPQRKTLRTRLLGLLEEQSKIWRYGCSSTHF